MESLRALFQPYGIDSYVIVVSDSHQNEYLGACDRRLGYITGFSGSNGVAVVTMDSAVLWTDGRYFLQARVQLKPGWQLTETPLVQWMEENASALGTIGTDPSLMSHGTYEKLSKVVERHGARWKPIETNLIDLIWACRPPRVSSPIHLLDVQFSGEHSLDKIQRIKKEMVDGGIDCILTSDLFEISWVLNCRGGDIKHCPVFYSYLIISRDALRLYVDDDKISSAIHEYFGRLGVAIRPYDAIVEDLRAMMPGARVGLGSNANHLLYSIVHANKIYVPCSVLGRLKAIKNQTEIEGMRACHTRDGAALCEYFSWLEDVVGRGEPSECDASATLYEIKRKYENFVGSSFETISASGPNAAIIHYEPNLSASAKITKDKIYLCDSGSQYYDGTTDVTRTMSFGTPTSYEKRMFTIVLKGLIGLSRCVFPSGTCGYQLDILSRMFLWGEEKDYGHSTGHGVGHFLSVHENPPSISPRASVEQEPLREGHVVTNEPGYYEEGRFGIRIENVMLVRKRSEGEYLEFETLTKAPIQKKMMDISLLDDHEIHWIDAYHSRVLEEVGPLLLHNVSALNWLRLECEPICRCPR